jgi:Uma2 family endonuclease
MTILAAPVSRSRIVYPDTDGLPMAENTLQFEWIVTIKGGLDHLFVDDPNVFVAGDLFWYPAEGHPAIRMAPDAMVAFGRPKGHRLSYLQWQEGGIPPQVVFEVLSPGNRIGELIRKFEFYQRYGVEEYYFYNPDPDRLDLSGFVRKDDSLIEIPTMNGHISPRLKVTFEMSEAGLRIIRPDGRSLETYGELAQREEQARRRADEERHRADDERRRADAERQRAQEADSRAKEERERADKLQAELQRVIQQGR